MAARPLIGLSGRRKLAGEVAGFPANLAAVPVDVYVGDYAAAVDAAGGLSVHLPVAADPAEYAGHLDGILLTGGADVDPARYGARADAAAHLPEPERDRMELGLIDAAAADGIPVLGICRGLQLLNVWGGGTLHQHVPDHARYDVPATATVDHVELVPGSRLHALYGAAAVDVNSLHHQTVDLVAPGWQVAGRSTDGVVEAMEWPGHDVVAVQWHPELMATRAVDPIFRWLVERAAARRLTRAPRQGTVT